MRCIRKRRSFVSHTTNAGAHIQHSVQLMKETVKLPHVVLVGSSVRTSVINADQLFMCLHVSVEVCCFLIYVYKSVQNILGGSLSSKYKKALLAKIVMSQRKML